MRWIWTKKRRDRAAKEADEILRSQKAGGSRPGPSHEREDVAPGHWREPGQTDFPDMRVTPATGVLWIYPNGEIYDEGLLG